QLEANIVAAQQTRFETDAVALHRGRDLVAHLHGEQLGEAEHVGVEASRSLEIGAAHADVREPLDRHVQPSRSSRSSSMRVFTRATSRAVAGPSNGSLAGGGMLDCSH